MNGQSPASGFSRAEDLSKLSTEAVGALEGQRSRAGCLEGQHFLLILWPWQTQCGGGVGMRLLPSLLAVWKERGGESNQGPPTAYRLQASLLFNGV